MISSVVLEEGTDIYVDQLFAVRKVCEKYLAKGKYVFWNESSWIKQMRKLIGNELWT